MTPEQFKAWFEGFCEGIAEAPTPEQWAKVKDKVADLRAAPLVLPRGTEYKRWFDGPPLPVTCGSGTPMPDRGHAIAINGPFSRETRVIDQLTGADLGPSD